MKCAADSTELTIINNDGSTTTIENKTIEVAPQGCKPVSEDVCKSGFMASAEDVTFPENPLDQCCMCKEDEICSYCANKYACTEEEKDMYMGDEECFGEPEPAPGPSSEKPTDESEGLWNEYKYLFIGIFLILVLLIIGLVASRSKTI
jgi:hypothetical protein